MLARRPAPVNVREAAGNDSVETTSQGSLEPGVATCHIPAMNRAKRIHVAHRHAKLAVDVAKCEHNCALTGNPVHESACAGGPNDGPARAKRLLADQEDVRWMR